MSVHGPCFGFQDGAEEAEGDPAEGADCSEVEGEAEVNAGKVEAPETQEAPAAENDEQASAMDGGQLQAPEMSYADRFPDRQYDGPERGLSAETLIMGATDGDEDGDGDIPATQPEKALSPISVGSYSPSPVHLDVGALRELKRELFKDPLPRWAQLAFADDDGASMGPPSSTSEHKRIKELELQLEWLGIRAIWFSDNGMCTNV